MYTFMQQIALNVSSDWKKNTFGEELFSYATYAYARQRAQKYNGSL